MPRNFNSFRCLLLVDIFSCSEIFYTNQSKINHLHKQLRCYLHQSQIHRQSFLSWMTSPLKMDLQILFQGVSGEAVKLVFGGKAQTTIAGVNSAVPCAGSVDVGREQSARFGALLTSPERGTTPLRRRSCWSQCGGSDGRVELGTD